MSIVDVQFALAKVLFFLVTVRLFMVGNTSIVANDGDMIGYKLSKKFGSLIT